MLLPDIYGWRSVPPSVSTNTLETRGTSGGIEKAGLALLNLVWISKIMRKKRRKRFFNFTERNWPSHLVSLLRTFSLFVDCHAALKKHHSLYKEVGFSRYYLILTFHWWYMQPCRLLIKKKMYMEYSTIALVPMAVHSYLN